MNVRYRYDIPSIERHTHPISPMLQRRAAALDKGRERALLSQGVAWTVFARASAIG
jgi:hypothetical protein